MISYKLGVIAHDPLTGHAISGISITFGRLGTVSVPFPEDTDEKKALIEDLSARKEVVDAATDAKSYSLHLQQAYEFYSGMIEDNDTKIYGAFARNSKNNLLYLYTGRECTEHTLYLPKDMEAHIRKLYESGFDPSPYVCFFRRCVVHPWYSKKSLKDHQEFINLLCTYILTPVLDKSLYTKLVDEGYSHSVATKQATVTNTPITTLGIIHTYRVMDLVTHKWVVKMDANGKPITDADGKPEKAYVPRLKETWTLDEDTGEQVKSVAEYEAAEDMLFKPTIISESRFKEKPENYGMQRGDVNVSLENTKLQWYGKIGQVLCLPSWKRVNCNHQQTAVPGIHTGGIDYIQGMHNEHNEVINSFVNPEDVGAVADQGAFNVLRVKQVYLHSVYSMDVPNKQFVTPSSYGSHFPVPTDTAVQAVEDARAKAAAEKAAVDNL